MSILSLYRGNASPGQLVDSSGNGFNLTKFGTVPNSSSPTPPEGDRWLAYHPPAAAFVNYLQGPSGTYNNAQGMVGFYFVVDAARGVQEFMWRFSSGFVSGHQASITVGDLLSVDLFENGLGLVQFQTPIVVGPTIHKFRYEWSAAGSKAYLDDVQFGSTAQLVNSVAPNLWLAGDPQSSANCFSSGGLDLFQSSNNPNEVFPPSSGLPWNNVFRRRKR